MTLANMIEELARIGVQKEFCGGADEVRAKELAIQLAEALGDVQLAVDIVTNKVLIMVMELSFSGSIPLFCQSMAGN